MKTLIDDVLKTIQQIYDELEHEIEDNEFKLFTIPITFTLLTRIGISLSSYVVVVANQILNPE